MAKPLFPHELENLPGRRLVVDSQVAEGNPTQSLFDNVPTNNHFKNSGGSSYGWTRQPPPIDLNLGLVVAVRSSLP